MVEKKCSIKTTAGQTLYATVSWDSNLTVTCDVYTTAFEWRLKKKGYEGNTGIVYGPRTTTSETFTFNADDGGEYIFQALDNLYYTYENNAFDVSGFTVTIESGGDPDDPGGSGGSSGGYYCIYIYEGEGTTLKVYRTWNQETQESYDGRISSGTEIHWNDYFDVTVGALDGYTGAKVSFTNFNITHEIKENADGTITYHGTMSSEDDIIVGSSATQVGGAEGDDPEENNVFKKGAYIGINNVARKIKYGYVGVDNLARKIKKAYIGIGGVARPCWCEGKLEYYGIITPLSVARSNLAATHVGNYALFGGGKCFNVDTGYSENSAAVDVYNAFLTRTTPPALSVARSNLAATHTANHALFGGGGSAVDAYDISMTRTSLAELSVSKSDLAATHIGGYALFGGGGSTVDVYNESLVKIEPISLSASMSNLAATHIDNYALFGGGGGTVDVYDTSLTRMASIDKLSASRSYLAATHVGDYALFGGGKTSQSGSSKIVDAYDRYLTRTTPSELSLARFNLAATHVGDYALFGGGERASTYAYVTDVYDVNLTRTTATNLSEFRGSLAATYVCDYALFGGGDDSFYVSTVDAYVLI